MKLSQLAKLAVEVFHLIPVAYIDRPNLETRAGTGARSAAWCLKF